MIIVVLILIIVVIIIIISSSSSSSISISKSWKAQFPPEDQALRGPRETDCAQYQLATL